MKEGGTGVLDVAGGKGELAFEFFNLNGIVSTVVDPRSLDLYRCICVHLYQTKFPSLYFLTINVLIYRGVRYKRKLRFGYYHKNDVLGVYNTEPKLSEEGDAKLPMHIRSYFEMSGVTNSCTTTDHFPTIHCTPLFLHSEDAYARALEHGARTCWTKKGLGHEDETTKEEDDDEATSTISETTAETSATTDTNECEGYKNRTDHGGVPVEDLSAARELVLKSSLLLGMHPDQAAEHIVEFSLRNNIPFCIIPCCVYSKQFPKRKLKDG